MTLKQLLDSAYESAAKCCEQMNYASYAVKPETPERFELTLIRDIASSLSVALARARTRMDWPEKEVLQSNIPF